MTRQVVTVSPSTPIKDAARILVDREFSALPVVEEGELVGIVTEADLLRLELPDPRTQLRPASSLGPAPSLVSEVMSQDVITVDEGADLATGAELMLQAAIKHLPVLRGRELV